MKPRSTRYKRRDQQGWTIAALGERGAWIAYVGRAWASEREAAAALADMLTPYPQDSRWRRQLRVARVEGGRVLV